MPHERKSFRAACVQMRSGLDRAANVDAALTAIAAASDAGAAFIATPEMTNVVDRDPARLLRALPEEEALDELAAFSAAAKKHSAWLLIGSLAVKVSEERAANRSYLFSPDGRIAARYDKLHMFDVQLPHGETWKESAVYSPGETAVVVRTPLAAFGLSICYDLRFPHLYRALARGGAEILAVPAAFTRQTGEAHWRTLLTARAIECGAYVIAPAQGGRHQDGRDTYGHSMIVGPWGEVVAESKDAEPGIIVGEIDPAKVEAARARIPNLALERRIEIRTINA